MILCLADDISLLLIFASFNGYLQSKAAFAAHSHNDYLQPVPFWDAFSAGCASIEVDVILQDEGQIK